MIIFNDRKYELFFSNNLAPLIALNYADELFFEKFEALCGKKYRILSIIRGGWQEKYCLYEDIQALQKHFESRIEDYKWVEALSLMYDEKSHELRDLLEYISRKDYPRSTDVEMIHDLKIVRHKSALLDAMSNMLHLFSSLIGHKFLERLKNYSNDRDAVNKNFIFYTQPIREGRFAKIKDRDLKDKFELSDEDSNFSDILRLGAFVKDDVSELLELRKKLMEKLFLEISKRSNCKAKDLEYFQISEIENLLLKKEDFSKLLEERKRLTVIFYQDNSLLVKEGDEAEDFIKENNFRKMPAEKRMVLKGQAASMGLAKGKVIIAKNSSEAAQKINKGDILVAPYTAVEYLPSMKKASAIITETGGITSHAAIVSRELGIPCVIGVKDATSILSDGDEVEVNADEGLVRVL